MVAAQMQLLRLLLRGPCWSGSVPPREPAAASYIAAALHEPPQQQRCSCFLLSMCKPTAAVPFKWEEAPGRARHTITARGNESRALARKLSRRSG
ncbi:unnamed protein product [Sphagnum troendelagicum]